MMNFLLLCSLLASIGAARANPVPREDGTLGDTQWNQPHNIVKELGLFKRADGENFSYTRLLLNGDTPTPQPSFATASRHHGHGLLRNEGNVFQGNQNQSISHHHFYAQDAVDFPTLHHQRYARVVPQSHDAPIQSYGQGSSEFYGSHLQSCVQDSAGSRDTFYQYQPSTQDTSSFHGSSCYPCGQRTSEYSHSHPQSHVQVSCGSRDYGFQRQPVTQGASWSHVSYLHPHGQGTSENSRSHHQSGVHEPHESHGLQSYPRFQDVSGSYDLLSRHRASYGTSEMSHPQVGEQQCQTHYQPPSAGACGEANDAEGGSTSAHMSSKAKRKRGPRKDKIREPPTPKFPTDLITRLDLDVALFYYQRERLAKLNNDPAYLRLLKGLRDVKGEPWVQVYMKIRRNEELLLTRL